LSELCIYTNPDASWRYYHQEDLWKYGSKIQDTDFADLQKATANCPLKTMLNLEKRRDKREIIPQTIR
jgi:hypothetical protein